MRDDFGDFGGVGAEALVELFRGHELMELGVAGRMYCGEELFGLVAVAHAKRDGDSEWRLRAECSAIDCLGSFASRIGQRNSPFNGSVGLGEHSRNTSQQGKARHKYAYAEFHGVHLEKDLPGRNLCSFEDNRQGHGMAAIRLASVYTVY